jgi:prepilin-type N-terminal cleavage/methylation domain-containing protein
MYSHGPRPSARHLRLDQRGFTLVEMMIVVALLTVLAAIAIPAYMKQIRRGRLAEVQAMMNEIAAKQQLFESFNGTFLGTAGFCPPNLGTGGNPVNFDVTACTGVLQWQELGIQIPRQTRFQYSFLAGTPGGDACTPPSGFPEACDTIVANTHWWVAVARADQDGDGAFARFITSSTMDGRVFMVDELE